MSKDWIIGVLGFSLLVVIMVVVMSCKGDKKNATPKHNGELSSLVMQSNFDPRVYMPLAIGNSWKYQWKRGTAPTVYNLTFLMGDDKNDAVIFTKLHPKLNGIYHETYRIVSFENGQYRFQIDCENTLELARDGRYDGSQRNIWEWKSEENGNIRVIQLRENIYRLFPENYDPALYSSKAGDLMLDKRPILVYVRVSGLAQEPRNYIRYGDIMVVETLFSENSIVVPAGTFPNCIKTVESFEGSGDDEKIIRWKNISYYAPNVGKVKEFQQLEDFTISYTMELESYQLFR